MTSFATLAEFITNTYNYPRHPVGIAEKVGFYTVEVGQIRSVNLVAENFGHGKLCMEIDALFEFVAHAKSHRQRRRYRGVTSA